MCPQQQHTNAEHIQLACPQQQHTNAEHTQLACPQQQHTNAEHTQLVCPHSSILMQSTHNRCVVSNRHMLFHSTHNCVSLSSRSSSSTCCWVVHTNEYLHYYPEYAVRALDSWHRQHGLLFPKTFHLWDSPSLPFKGYQGSSPEIKKPGHEFNHSPLSNARVKNERSDTTSPLPPLLSCCGQDFFFKLFFTSSWL